MMKRHALRPGMSILTLSLLSSLTLLTACGGGGKDAPAPAPALPSMGTEQPKVPDPTVASVTAADEPYIVAASSLAKLDKSFTPAYQLNILDGKTQATKKSFSFSSPIDQQWITTKKTVRTLDTSGGGRQYVEVEKGSHSLYVIMPVGDEHQVFQIDLAQGSDLVPKRISSIKHACQIVGSYLINKDGSDAAIYVKEVPDGKDCSSAADNVQTIVRTNDAATTPSRKPLTTDDAIVAKLFKDGVLTGVLAKENVTNDKGVVTQGQLVVLAPTLDSKLQSTAVSISATVSKFSTLADYPLEGVEWIADAPGEVNAGYFRLQQFDFSDNAYTNRLYKLTWDADKNTTSVSAVLYNLEGGVISNKGLNDNKYVYFTNKDLVMYGPTATGQFDALASLKDYLDVNAIGKLVPSYQTGTHLVITQGSPVTAAFSVKKNPDLDKQVVLQLFNTANAFTQADREPQTILGISGSYLISKQRSSYDELDPKATSLKRTNIETGYAEFMNELNRLNVLATIWSATTTNGSRELVSAIVCSKTPSTNGDCAGSGENFRTADFNKMTFGLTLGTLGSTLSSKASVKVPEIVATVNSYFDVTRVVGGGLATYRDPWMFNPGLKGSLKLVTTSTPPTTPSK
jgi:hypothetical protein